MAKSVYDAIAEMLGTAVNPVENPELTSVGTTAAVLFRNNPNRYAWIVTNLSGNTMFIALAPNVSSSRGIRLNANGGQVTVIWQEDLVLVPHEWFIISDGANSNLFSVELVGGPGAD